MTLLKTVFDLLDTEVFSMLDSRLDEQYELMISYVHKTQWQSKCCKSSDLTIYNVTSFRDNCGHLLVRMHQFVIVTVACTIYSI